MKIKKKSALQSKDFAAQSLIGHQSSNADDERSYADLNSADPKSKLLYITPEKVMSTTLVNTLDELYRNEKLDRFVIYEAHCASSWGLDFRLSYRELGKLRRKYPGIPIMALTTTATKLVREDIINQLGIPI